VRKASVWARLLGVERAVIEQIEFDDEEGLLICHVRPVKAECGRCGVCRRRCGRYDGGAGRRRWRALDLGTVRAVLEADAPRVRCPAHGVVVAAVPWARHGAGHTRFFDDQVAWLAVACSKTAVCQLMRIAWRSVGAIVARVCADVDAVTDRLAGLRRIGIDEISYKKGHKYLTVVVDHDSGLLVWAGEGHDAKTLGRFFAALGERRCKLITHVCADAADWIAKAVGRHCPRAVLCADPFHVIKWATEALGQVRREAWNDARRQAGKGWKDNRGRHIAKGHARALKHARWALWKNPGNLTGRQQAKLGWIATTDPRLYRAYLLKEGLRYVFQVKGQEGKQALDRWCSWAQRCRIGPFVELGRMIKRHRPAIDAALEHGLSNALIESTNTKIRLITRIAFGFKDPTALIALAMLSLGGYRPPLPGRPTFMTHR
jgi:transposase